MRTLSHYSCVLLAALALPGCKKGGEGAIDSGVPPETGGEVTPPAASCESAGGNTAVAAPTLEATLSDSWEEAWLGSPAIADINGDGTPEIVAARGGKLLGWHLDNTVVLRADTGSGRIWASPVVADLLPSRPGLEVAAAGRDKIFAFDSTGASLPGFPFIWQDELRSLAAGDIDGDGGLELVAVSTNGVEGGGQKDIVIAVHNNGAVVAGFPPNTTGTSGCDDACYVTGGFDQNIALGDVDGDGVAEVFATQDNAYLSLHKGNGRAFDCAPIFKGRTKFPGVRAMLDYSLAQQGWAEDEQAANQGHFTNSAPAIADLDGDGKNELIVLGSVQNAAQSERERGVAIWVLRADATRPDAWIAPFHAPEYLSGLWDLGETNIVAATNQIAVADIDPSHAGPELIFAGFDGRIHCVDATAKEVWRHTYTTDKNVLTGGVVVADLSGDGTPEIVFTTYATDPGKSALVILDSGGNELHSIALPGRGAMPVPTIGNADNDEALEIAVSLKDAEGGTQQLQIYEVASAKANCLLWPTGRGNNLRSGFVRPKP